MRLLFHRSNKLRDTDQVDAHRYTSRILVHAGLAWLRFGLCPASERDSNLLSEAVNLAKEADFAIVFTGHEQEWGTEGQDQRSFEMPRAGSQNALVSAVPAAYANTVVVNSTGVAIAMPWVNEAAAILQAWFAGHELGISVFDVLLGHQNPEGHLPVAFPKSLEDAPAFRNFPGTYQGDRSVVPYEEGVFVGYRHYDRLAQEKVNYPFGHGLSYAIFDYDDLKVDRPSEDAVSISVGLQNTGNCYGGTVVQVYAGQSDRDPAHPLKKLVVFEKVGLAAGQKHRSILSVSIKELAYFDEKLERWVVRAGKYEFSVGHSGHSSADIVRRATIDIAKEYVYEP
ncbi:hypothetical protein ASPCAL14971 [Aspergillus calidoustus]|uniref:beta-glucosidase n=1 Tax=Aspergillus calidoustus TaxID=454130 RepID=A0A0U5HCA7_ASPCI|nr:hypothetical protein ASPCAL14971 [Aspergillus calidoustus]